MSWFFKLFAARSSVAILGTCGMLQLPLGRNLLKQRGPHISYSLVFTLLPHPQCSSWDSRLFLSLGLLRWVIPADFDSVITNPGGPGSIYRRRSIIKVSLTKNKAQTIGKNGGLRALHSSEVRFLGVKLARFFRATGIRAVMIARRLFPQIRAGFAKMNSSLVRTANRP